MNALNWWMLALFVVENAVLVFIITKYLNRKLKEDKINSKKEE